MDLLISMNFLSAFSVVQNNTEGLQQINNTEGQQINNTEGQQINESS